MSGLLCKASVWAFAMGWQPWDRDHSLLEGWARSGPLVPLGVLTQGVSCTFFALTHGWCPYPPKPKGTRRIPGWASSFHKGQHLGGGTQFFFQTFYFVLGYGSRSTTLRYFQMDSKGTQSHIYTHTNPFSPKFPSHPGCHITLNRVSCIVQ